MSIFDFNRAIVREPGGSVVNGIRTDPNVVVDYEGILGEHRAYVGALRAAGLKVEVLPPLQQYPDSIFVEDPALVLPEGAILLRPGAPGRRGESGDMRGVLKRHFQQVFELDGDEFADGGDVLITPAGVLIGTSRRTNRAGANALRAKLDRFGRKSRIVETPEGILHLKTAASLLDENVVLATARVADSGIFADFRILVVPLDEAAAANALRINDTVLVGACFPRTAELVAREGFRVQTLPVTETGKLDAGLSCMSLRWHAQS
ncbi:MAG TPA: arginine deiminase family protein [Rhizomicrobium sp.]|nr:arginine deiminase family protein [Rhizomicrobium sp.]